jgi:hypothetical protein
MTDASKRVVGRRTVVRGAVVTAWSVPLVQAVASAPALAGTVHSGPADLTSSSGTPTTNGNTFVINATVVNGGGSATSALTAVLSWNGADGSKIEKTTVPTGWTPVKMKDPVTSWTANNQIAAGGSQALKISFSATNPTGKPKASGTATVSLTTAGGTGTSFTVTF